ncbi:MAG: hypothetical protein CM1200mP30_19260 [Pseudomonadota bacterium]|nr:MAG: hypothetical protein CM1200mP30_19260 [Pseudomonadota bacterium]
MWEHWQCLKRMQDPMWWDQWHAMLRREGTAGLQMDKDVDYKRS